MDNKTPTICDFCGKPLEEVKKIFSSENAHICDECIEMCSSVLSKETLQEAKKEFQQGLSVPIKIKEHLDDYVIGQTEAKRFQPLLYTITTNELTNRFIKMWNWKNQTLC